MDQAMPEPALGDLLRLLSQALNARLVADVTGAGFTEVRSAHFAVFKHLDSDGARQTDLAARAQMTKQSMCALIDDLERWGYVERVVDPADARARIVRQTERGRALDRVARASIRAFEEDRERQIGAERMRLFRALLTELATGGS